MVELPNMILSILIKNEFIWFISLK